MKLPMDIDIQFDMRIDGGDNPDKNSATLRKYHQILWSKRLPNGEFMDLKINESEFVWEKFKFSSDTLTNCFKKYVKKNKSFGELWNEIKKNHNGDSLYKEYQKICNTIGGFIIFPTSNSINRRRGIDHQICDRIDLTLECIRRYYCKKEDPNFNKKNPLSVVLEANSAFFDLFGYFQGYVDFFFLQDLLVKENGQPKYDKEVNIIFGDANFANDDFDPLPTTVEEWKKWRKGCIDFVKKRNERILEACENGQLALNLKNTLDILNQKCEWCKKQLRNSACIFSHSDIADILSRQYDYLVKLDATAVQNVFKDDMDKYKNYLKNIKSIK